MKKQRTQLSEDFLKLPQIPKRIPLELIREVLLNVSVRKLVAFRAVSRHWVKIIDDSEFVKEHLKSAIRGNRFDIFLRDDDEDDSRLYRDVLYLSYEDYTHAQMVDHPYKHNPDLTVRISCSCNGVMYVEVQNDKNSSEKFSLLWNVCTRQTKLMSAQPNFTLPTDTNSINTKSAIGYSEKKDDYYVVKIYQFRDRNNDYIDSVVLLYNLSSDSWKRTSSPDMFMGEALWSNIVTNLNPHWEVANEDREPICIMGFDLEREIFVLPPNPRGVEKISTGGFLDGCLSVLVADDANDSADLWVMRTYGDVDSWERCLTIHSSLVISDPSTLRVLFYKGNNIVFKDTFGQIIVYNPRNQNTTPLPLYGLPGDTDRSDYCLTIYVGSLVPVAARDKELATLHDGGRGSKKNIEDNKDANKRGSLHYAAREGKIEVCKYLLEELKLDIDTKDQDGETALLHATRSGHVDTVKYLVEFGADPSISSDPGATPLHYAAGTGNIELLQYLLAKGVDVDSQSDTGTPLIWAAGRGEQEAVKILLEHHANAGAKLNISAGGATPLHIAANSGSTDILSCLLKAGADPNFTDENGLKPIQVAAARNNRGVVETLLPLTSPVKNISTWSIDGIIKHMQSEGSREQEERPNCKEVDKPEMTGVGKQEGSC